MILGKKTLFPLLLAFYLLTNILEITYVNFFYTTTIIAFCTCLLLPGFLISLILRVRKLSLWENIVLVVGFGVAFLEFGGLLLNIVLPLFGVKDPLAFQNIVYGFDVLLLTLFAVAWVRTKKLEVRILLPKRSSTEKVFYLVPVFFPIFAALGAIVLNNGGSDILTLILLGAIAVYSLLLVLFRDKIAVDLHPYAIFFIAVASLFTTSLRSWYITGHDIEREFYVFQLTNTHHLWSMAFYQDAYNACLSITILPTLLSNLLLIQDIYVYKVIFQIIFAVAPVLVFYIVANYAAPVIAFLSAFLFISFPTFFNDMPMLNRQEIGFIFFGLVLYMMLLSKLSLRVRKISFIIFSLGVIVSHYSTNFVVLGLVTFVYVFTFIASLSFVKNSFAWLLSTFHIRLKNTYTDWYASEETIVIPQITPKITPTYPPRSRYQKRFLSIPSRPRPNHAPEKPATGAMPPGFVGKPFQTKSAMNRDRKSNATPTWYANEETIAFTKITQMLLSLPLILTLFFMTYVWNNLYTNSSNHAGSVLSQAVGSLFLKSSSDAQSNDLSYNIFSSHKQDPKQQLQSYINGIIQSEGSKSDFYSDAITSKYPSYPIPQEQLVPTPLGNVLTTLHIPVFDIQAELRTLSADFMQVFVFIGLLAVFFFKNKKPFDLQYSFLCFGSLFMLTLIIVIPSLSVEYGLLRMFQQLLFVFSLLIVIGIRFILFFIKEQKRIAVAAIIVMIFFLNLTGFVSHLTGDYYPQLTLDNSGLYYDAYYVHKSDIQAIVWLSKNNVDHEPVEAGLSGSNKMMTYGGIYAVDNIFPSVTLKDAYVYLETSSPTVASIDTDVEIFNSSKPFLDDNKNLVYSNGKDNIYK